MPRRDDSAASPRVKSRDDRQLDDTAYRPKKYSGSSNVSRSTKSSRRSSLAVPDASQLCPSTHPIEDTTSSIYTAPPKVEEKSRRPRKERDGYKSPRVQTSRIDPNHPEMRELNSGPYGATPISAVYGHNRGEPPAYGRGFDPIVPPSPVMPRAHYGEPPAYGHGYSVPPSPTMARTPAYDERRPSLQVRPPLYGQESILHMSQPVGPYSAGPYTGQGGPGTGMGPGVHYPDWTPTQGNGPYYDPHQNVRARTGLKAEAHNEKFAGTPGSAMSMNSVSWPEAQPFGASHAYGDLRGDSLKDGDSVTSEQKRGCCKGGSVGSLSKRYDKWWIDFEHKRLCIGSLITLAVAITIGIIIFVAITQSMKNGKSASGYSVKSSQVSALMNDKSLHKVFPAIDYTSLNTQYPACLDVKPSQDNVTLDIAVLSQLTNTLRLYGTDCNQTELVLNAIKALELQDTMKVWAGVYLDNNATTNTRQVMQFYDVVSKYDTKMFAGVIVGNEVIFRNNMAISDLGNIMNAVRTSLSKMKINIPVTTSDIGSVWNAELVSYVDIVMANIHPFFAGISAPNAAAWTWSYWQNTDVRLVGNSNKTSIIAETGWPSEGGSAGPAVAGTAELQTFLDTWVCQALANGTQYFMFEAVDQPWAAMYDTKDLAIESHWGLLDVNRKLKANVTIPDCGGKTV